MKSGEAFTPISREDELDLVARAQAGDRAAANRLVRVHQPYITQAARRYARGVWSVEDLVAAASLGFAIAIKRFNASYGARLLTYASHWMKCEMQHEVERATIFGRPPSGSEEYVIRHLTRLGLDDAEGIANALGVKVSTVASAMRLFYLGRGKSMDSVGPWNESLEGRSLHDVVADEAPTPEEAFARAETDAVEQHAVAVALRELDPRTRQILSECTMASDGEAISLAEAGRRWGISRERARQLERIGLSRMRSRIEPALVGSDNEPAPRSSRSIRHKGRGARCASRRRAGCSDAG